MFNCCVLALDKTGFAQTLVERGDQMHGIVWRPTAHKPDYRHGRLLRPRSKGPANSAGRKRNELPPPHVRLVSIYSR